MNLQRYIISLIGLLLLFGFIPPTYAQTPTPPAAATTTVTPPTPQPQATPGAVALNVPGTAEVTLAQFNQETFELQSPIAQYTFTFELSHRWELVGDNNYFELHYDAYLPVDTSSLAEDGVKGVVNIYVDESLVKTFTPPPGTGQVLKIPIPPATINDTDSERHKIRFVYFSGNCEVQSGVSSLVVHNDSLLHFDYNLKPLEINLADFPQPLIQNLFVPESILLVLPDEYNDADLAAAASVAATLGQQTSGNVTFELLTAAEATPERLAETNVVVIGQPERNAFLAALYQSQQLPTTLTAEGQLLDPLDQPIPPDDGVLQEIVSEVDDNYVYLILTGGSDTAVTRAARALSVLGPRYGFEGNLVVIADFQEIISEAQKSTDTFTLADLNFRDDTFYGVETHRSTLQFFIPGNWQMQDNASLNLSYVNSASLQASGSGLTINLNNKPVGSAPIDDKVLGERQVTMKLPASDFKRGTYNQLSFEAVINIELPDCVLPELDLAWVRLNEQSQLYLPHTLVDSPENYATLEDALSPFISRQDLTDVWFSLPEQPTPAELAGLLKVAAWLGNFSRGPGFAPHVSRGAISDMAQVETYNIIAFGQPTTNPLIAMLNEQLPQPFVPGENTLRQQVGNVTYRLPERFSLGLLQTLLAPWNPKQVILIATGTTTEGVTEAIASLTNDDIYYELEGNVAFISQDRVESFESTDFIRGPLVDGVEKVIETAEITSEVALEVVPAPLTTTVALSSTTPITPAPAGEAIADRYFPATEDKPPFIEWLTIGLIGSGIFVAAVGSVVSWWKRSRSAKREY